jgi:hypothetical protein
LNLPIVQIAVDHGPVPPEDYVQQPATALSHNSVHPEEAHTSTTGLAEVYSVVQLQMPPIGKFQRPAEY